MAAEIIAGDPVIDGEMPLQKLWKVRLPGRPVDQEVNRRLLKEAQRYRIPGFRKGSKVVPPMVRANRGSVVTGEVLNERAAASLNAKIADLQALPGVTMRDYVRTGDEYELTYMFEVQPEIQAPAIAGKTVRRPVPRLDDAAIDTILLRMREGRADWRPVDREAKFGDRVKFKFPNEDKPRTPIISAALPEDIRTTLIGTRPGSTVELDLLREGDARPRFKIRIDEVHERLLPELDLAFAQQVSPEVRSVDEFREQISGQVRRQAAKLSADVFMRRIITLIDRETPEFELPEHMVQVEAVRRRDSYVKQQRERGQPVAPELTDPLKVIPPVRMEVRREMALQGFMSAHQLAATQDEVMDFLRHEAQDHVNPDEFIANATSEQGKQVWEQAFRAVVLNKVIAVVVQQVQVADEDVDLDTLNRYHQGDDPELAPPPADDSAAAAAAAAAAPAAPASPTATEQEKASE